MTPADKRVLELVNRWLQSLELHLKYAELDDAAYSRVQAWPKHDRPTKWVLELAKQKALELKAHCEKHAAGNDSSFAESLEQMNFLSNLVGAQNIQRFIPLAEPQAASPTPAAVKKPAEPDEDDTREMPQPKFVAKKAGEPEPPVKLKAVKKAKAVEAPSSAQDTVMADAVRLLKWGRNWHELAELIARMADRPAIGEVRRILRENKSLIESSLAG